MWQVKNLSRSLPTKLLALFALLLLLGTLLTGCGGGGGGGGGNNPSNGNDIQITGQLIDTADNNEALPGWTIEFDGGFATTTDSGGHFTLNVPPGNITGSDQLSVLDTNGTLQLVETFDFNAIPGNPKSAGTLTIGPPVIPPLVKH